MIHYSSAFDGFVKKLILMPAALFLVDLILGGPKGLIQAVPFRHILFFATFVSLFVYISLYRKWQVKAWLTFPIFFILLFTFINILWGLPFALFSSVVEANALRESLPYTFLLLLPLLFLCSQDDSRALSRINRLVILLTGALSFLQISMWIVGSFLPGMGIYVRATTKIFFSADSIYVGLMPDGFYRVFWISSLWAFVALFLVPFSIKSKQTRYLLYFLFLTDLFISYSRGVWLGVIVGIIVARLLIWRVTAKSIQNGLFIFSLMLCIFVSISFLNFSFPDNRLTTTFSTEDKSVGERLYQFDCLIEKWEQHSFFGTGYGAFCRNYVRSESAPYSYELVPAAMLMKLGIIGFLLYWGGWLIMIAYALMLRRRCRLRSACFVGGLCGYAIVVNTNPMLVNFVGIAIFSLFYIQWAYLFKPSNTNVFQDAYLER